jgi:hypothetical protein
MTGENGFPETPEWECPKRPEPEPKPTILPSIILGEN